MLNRRHLRIKVLHALYAYYSSDERDLPKGERQLIFSVNKFFELYVLLFSVVIELRKYAENRMELAKKRLLPSEEDLNPNIRFVENKFIKQLENNEELHEGISKLKILWSDEERPVIKNIYQEVIASDEYQEYMTAGEGSYDLDKKVVVSLFKKIICNNERLHSEFEERSIFWSDDLDLACSMVIKSLKKMDAKTPMTLLPLYKDEEERRFVLDLYKYTIITSDDNMGRIKTKLQNWDEDRLARMDVLLMKMALAEAANFPSIPYKVTLNEYIEISKFYSTPDSKMFINGILDKIFAEMKKDGSIRKIGRGLLDS